MIRRERFRPQPVNSATNLLESSLGHPRSVPFPYLPRPGLDLEADMGLNLNDLDPIGVWYDQGPSSYTSSQATAGSKPTFKATAGPGSRPCVNFDGTADNMAILPSTLSFTTGYTIFAVLKPADSSSRTIICGDSGSGLQYRISGLKQEILKANVASIGTSTTSLSTSAFQQCNVTYNGSAFVFRLGRAADGSGTNAQTVAGIYQIGARGIDLAEKYSGDICVLRVYLCVLTLAQIIAIETEIFNRWGV